MHGVDLNINRRCLEAITMFREGRHTKRSALANISGAIYGCNTFSDEDKANRFGTYFNILEREDEISQQRDDGMVPPIGDDIRDDGRQINTDEENEEHSDQFYGRPGRAGEQ
jgi:hypothetical protein